jgi:hypothetical protein
MKHFCLLDKKESYTEDLRAIWIFSNFRSKYLIIHAKKVQQKTQCPTSLINPVCSKMNDLKIHLGPMLIKIRHLSYTLATKDKQNSAAKSAENKNKK